MTDAEEADRLSRRRAADADARGAADPPAGHLSDSENTGRLVDTSASPAGWRWPGVILAALVTGGFCSSAARCAS
jgi:hypothetical protein